MFSLNQLYFNQYKYKNIYKIINYNYLKKDSNL